MTRMTGPDCAVMCNLINKYTNTHTHKTEPGRFDGVTVEALCQRTSRKLDVSRDLCLFRVGGVGDDGGRERRETNP